MITLSLLISIVIYKTPHAQKLISYGIYDLKEMIFVILIEEISENVKQENVYTYSIVAYKKIKGRFAFNASADIFCQEVA